MKKMLRKSNIVAKVIEFSSFIDLIRTNGERKAMF